MYYKKKIKLEEMKGRTENLICAIPIILIILGLMVVGASYIFDIFELDGFARWGVFWVATAVQGAMCDEEAKPE